MQISQAIVPDAIDVDSVSEIDERRLRWEVRVGVRASDGDTGALDDQWDVLDELFPGLFPLSRFCVTNAIVVCVGAVAGWYVIDCVWGWGQAYLPYFYGWSALLYH